MAASGLLSTLTKEQRAIMEAATLGHSIFITGAAGTGKSFVVKNLIKTLPEAGFVATSSTGISSVQLGGVTIHTFVGIGNSAASDSILRVLNNKCAIERIKSAKILLIDEGSMISLRLFELFNRIFQLIRADSNHFGGMQVIFIADCITVGNQPSKSTWIQRLKAIVFTKFLKAGINFSRADIAVGLRFIMLKNPVKIYRKGQEYWYSSHSKPYDEERMK